MYDYEYKEFFPQPLRWLPVVGFEESHEVNNYGVVRSIERTKSWWRDDIQKEITRTFPSKILNPKLTEDGYLDIHLRNGEDNKYRRLHRIVAEAFLSNDPATPVVDHKNDDKQYNPVWNLQKVTVQYNTQKAVDSGAMRSGNGRYSSSIPEKTKTEIRELLAEGTSMRSIARLTGVSQRSIARIRDGII